MRVANHHSAPGTVSTSLASRTYYIGISHSSMLSTQGQGVELIPLSSSGTTLRARQPAGVWCMLLRNEWVHEAWDRNQESCVPRLTSLRTCLLALDKSLYHPGVWNCRSLGAFCSLTAYDTLGNTQHNQIHSG